MITELDISLLDAPLDGFIHSCNCFHTMGGGIALQIKNKYPEALVADINHGRKGDISRLGTFSFVKTWDDKYIYNLYGQYKYGRDKRHTNYDAVYTGLVGIRNHAELANVLKLGLPKFMGCTLGGGDWRVVRSIVEIVFGNFNGELVICNYEPTQ